MIPLIDKRVIQDKATAPIKETYEPVHWQKEGYPSSLTTEELVRPGDTNFAGGYRAECGWGTWDMGGRPHRTGFRRAERMDW